MSKISLRAVITIIIATGLFCAAILFGKDIAICFTDKSELTGSDKAVVSQTLTLASTAEAQSPVLNKAKMPASAAGYFEPFWLLVLGATLLAIGTSIKLLIRTPAKAPLPGNKSERVL
ncbi:MAG TPA: hypothetical protein VJX74_08745 [Blastocatellia bacterium]|nr:hypothetical protein [Blastocatellia bacterium]